jgi:hypothetical protein
LSNICACSGALAKYTLIPGIADSAHLVQWAKYAISAERERLDYRLIELICIGNFGLTQCRFTFSYGERAAARPKCALISAECH